MFSPLSDCLNRYFQPTVGLKFLGYHGPGHGYYNYGVGSIVTRDMMQGNLNMTIKQGNSLITHGRRASRTLALTIQNYTAYERQRISKNIGQNIWTRMNTFFMWAAHHGIHSEMDEDLIPPHLCSQRPIVCTSNILIR